MPQILTTTKHFQLTQRLRQKIRHMRPGERLPTLAEFMKDHQASQATLERALGRLRREGLIYRPAGRQRLVVSPVSDPARWRIALIRPDYPSADIEGLTRVMVEAGRKTDWQFDLVYYRSIEGLDLNRVMKESDAAILMPTLEPLPEHLRRALICPHRPVVVIHNPFEGVTVPQVHIDDREVGRLAAKHLAELGHRRILAMDNEPPSPSAKSRLAGWREVMESLGEKDLDSLQINCGTQSFENSLEKAYEYFSRWMARPHPHFTALFCANAMGMVAAMRVFRENGISVPAQVSAVSYAGESGIAAYLNPPLTVVEADMGEYGGKIVALMETLLEGRPSAGEPVLIRPELVVRQSTAGAPA